MVKIVIRVVLSGCPPIREQNLCMDFKDSFIDMDNSLCVCRGGGRRMTLFTAQYLL